VSAEDRAASALAGLAACDLFDAGVHVVAGRIGAPHAPLFAEEMMAIVDAVPRRVAEFRAGRALARAALRQAGGDGVSIPMRADRSPIWPAGWIGSISHSGDVCAAAAAPAGPVCGLGLDIELNDLADERMLRYVCTQAELARATDALPGRDLAPRLLFSAKEAFYKAYHPLYARFVGFLDVQVRLAPAADGAFGTFAIEPVSANLVDAARHAFAGRWRIAGGAVLAGVTCLRR
jgi:4'-phosphopantetheinyl transferase EntD